MTAHSPPILWRCSVTSPKLLLRISATTSHVTCVQMCECRVVVAYISVMWRWVSRVFYAFDVLIVDWMIADMLAIRQGSIGHIRYILKDSLKFLPLYGAYFRQVSGHCSSLTKKNVTIQWSCLALLDYCDNYLSSLCLSDGFWCWKLLSQSHSVYC